MAEQQTVVTQCVDDEEEDTPGYKAPAQKSLDEIKQQDQDDESLVKYKETLLGTTGSTPPFPENPANVIVKEMVLLMLKDGEEKRMIVDLMGDDAVNKAKETKICLPEGCSYRVQINFFVQREIVSGLKYIQTVYRKGIRVDKESCMVGSYGPKKEAQEYKSREEEAPSGMLVRGDYQVKSKFTDDDKNSHLEWEWKFTIKKDKESKE